MKNRKTLQSTYVGSHLIPIMKAKQTKVIYIDGNPYTVVGKVVDNAPFFTKFDVFNQYGESNRNERAQINQFEFEPYTFQAIPTALTRPVLFTGFFNTYVGRTFAR